MWDKTDNKVTWKFNAEPNTEGDVSFTVKVNESISGENGEINNSALVGNRTTNITHNYLPGKTADKDANTTLKVGDELTYTCLLYTSHQRSGRAGYCYAGRP